MQNKRKIKLTPVSVLHYVRLAYRSALFAALLVMYIIYKVRYGEDIAVILNREPAIVVIICAVFTLEMLLRFFPSRLESPGSQKQFAQNYIKSGETSISIQENNATMLVALVWIVFNGIFGALHMMGVLDDGIMLLLSVAYSVCDMICILFFCPFQTWFLKNKCCSSCRIYNWDYAMMFTPLFFVRGKYTWGLLILSVALLIRWEITFYRYPERFSPVTNEYLRCANCTEKLCTHKRQLKTLWTQIAELTEQRLKALRK